MISELVGRSKLIRTSPSNSRLAPCSGVLDPAAGAGAGVALPRERDRPPAAPVTVTPVTAPMVCASSSQLAFSQ